MNIKLTTAKVATYAKIARIAAAMLLVSALVACGSAESLNGEGADDSSSKTLTIGSANFSEATVLAYIYAAALDDAGIETTVKPNIGSREVFIPALKDGSIDLIP